MKEMEINETYWKFPICRKYITCILDSSRFTFYNNQRNITFCFAEWRKLHVHDYVIKKISQIAQNLIDTSLMNFMMPRYSCQAVPDLGLTCYQSLIDLWSCVGGIERCVVIYLRSFSFCTAAGTRVIDHNELLEEQIRLVSVTGTWLDTRRLRRVRNVGLKRDVS